MFSLCSVIWSDMVETLGDAFNLGWEFSARCGWGNRDGLKTIRVCQWRTKIDLETLLATRGRDFPVTLLASRLRCPRCGSRKVLVYMQPPARRARI